MADGSYLTAKDVGQIFKRQTDIPLSFFHLNVQSLSNKFDELSIFLNEFCFCFDLIMLTETWFSHECDVINLEGYHVVFMNRSSRRGGGVSIYVRSGIQCTLIHEFTSITDNYEIVTLEHGKNVFFCFVSATLW